MKFVMGDGDNLYDLDHLFHFENEFTLTAGKGNDNIGNLRMNTTTAGDVELKLGNGNNTVNFFVGGSSPDKIQYFGGTGVDSVTLNGHTGGFKGVFGDGNDVFRYAPGASVGAGDLFADFGPGNDTYVRSPVTVTWNENLKHLENII